MFSKLCHLLSLQVYVKSGVVLSLIKHAYWILEMSVLGPFIQISKHTFSCLLLLPNQ